MLRHHIMPFGTQLLTDDRICFRLWAPGADQVEVQLYPNDGDELISEPMKPKGDGWFEISSNQAAVGDLYHYRINRDIQVPDPASRYNPNDVHGPSQVLDPRKFDWQDTDWEGRPWEEAVIYELHTGTFTPQGTFTAIKEKLDYFVELGVTAIELMPLADFPGSRNWGYDGVLPYAPDASYGHPDDLKDLIQTAHQKNLMVFLDVVYNHFGPEGNYLHVYAPQFFTDRHQTPWGAAINFDGSGSRPVRDFFIHNALYWLEEFHFDGLRLDAVHAIMDDSQPDILQELAEAVRKGPGKDRHVHLVLENDDNIAHYLGRNNTDKPHHYDAQWNDDIHHVLHCIVTNESDGYYADYATHPVQMLGRCLTEGFAYQGDPSTFRDGTIRGEPSRFLPPTAFVAFSQNHDQVGNRAFGERISQLAEPSALRAITEILLIAPSPPLLFMGQEFAAAEPFLFFCQFGPDLAQLVTEGRRREFARFAAFNTPEAQARIPDPNDAATFEQSRIRWESLNESFHQEWFALHQQLLSLRHQEIAPRLYDMEGDCGNFNVIKERGLIAHWLLGDSSRLALLANLGNDHLTDITIPEGRVLYASDDRVLQSHLEKNLLPSWTVLWFLHKE